MGILSRLFGQKPEKPDPLEAELADWCVVTAHNDDSDERVCMRLRIARPNLEGIESFTTAVEIEWRWADEGWSPPEQVETDQVEFEDALCDLSGDNGYSELVMVRTGFGAREWLYYTSDQARFMSELNTLLENHEQYPIDIKFYDDAGWEIWKDVLETVSDRA